jgi:hypothetical protein
LIAFGNYLIFDIFAIGSVTTMMTIPQPFTYSTLLCALLFTSNVMAGESVYSQPTSLCPIAKAQDENVAVAVLWQQLFDGGVYDLAMALPHKGSPLDIKRVTFGGSATPMCHYKALALARGGDWGWHLAWVVAGIATLSYARMDGEAWVSSPTKKLSKNAQLAGEPVILSWEHQVWIVWQASDEQDVSLFAVFSADEGRSWQEAKLVAKVPGKRALSQLSKLQLVVKEQKPYLSWDDATEFVPLLIW